MLIPAGPLTPEQRVDLLRHAYHLAAERDYQQAGGDSQGWLPQFRWSQAEIEAVVADIDRELNPLLEVLFPGYLERKKRAAAARPGEQVLLEV